MRIAIVEDELIVAQRLERMIREIAGDDAESIAHAPSLRDAIALVAKEEVDLLFLDLNLNGRNGFHLLEQAAAARFQTIVVSAHHGESLRAFEYGVTDFVAKPFSEERLRKAIERARGVDPSDRRPARVLAIRKGSEIRTIAIERIVFIRGADDFSELHLDDGSCHLHQKSLGALVAMLPSPFVRVHRSYIVNLDRARGLRGTSIVVNDGPTLPVGRTYRTDVRRHLGL